MADAPLAGSTGAADARCETSSPARSSHCCSSQAGGSAAPFMRGRLVIAKRDCENGPGGQERGGCGTKEATGWQRNGGAPPWFALSESWQPRLTAPHTSTARVQRPLRHAKGTDAPRDSTHRQIVHPRREGGTHREIAHNESDVERLFALSPIWAHSQQAYPFRVAAKLGRYSRVISPLWRLRHWS